MDFYPMIVVARQSRLSHELAMKTFVIIAGKNSIESTDAIMSSRLIRTMDAQVSVDAVYRSVLSYNRGRNDNGRLVIYDPGKRSHTHERAHTHIVAQCVAARSLRRLSRYQLYYVKTARLSKIACWQSNQMPHIIQGCFDSAISKSY